MISLILAMAAAQAEPIAREREGNWHISDITDNNTGEREVYAMQLDSDSSDRETVFLYMRCHAGKPVLNLEWLDLRMPRQAVVIIGPVQKNEPFHESYIFTKSDETSYRGWQASPETSEKVIRAIGSADFTTISVEAATGVKVIGMNIEGTQRAWQRVSRHCPVRTYPLPPI